jgi:hypothetical protein
MHPAQPGEYAALVVTYRELIKVGQQNARYVSWQTTGLVAHWILKEILATERR